MSSFRTFSMAAVCALVVLTVGFVESPQASAENPVGATSWSNANAAPASGPAQLNGVYSATSTFCVAVGTQNIGVGLGALIEQWNGTSWSVVPNVPGGGTGNGLSSVSCAGPDFCMAVGTIAEMWNGTAWSLSTGGSGTSVSCVSTTVCEALTTVLVGGTTPEVVGEQWNGTSWSPVPAATPAATGAPPVIEVTAMYCVDADWCIAVGDTDVQTPSGTPFAEVWNGSSWNLSTVVVPGGVTGSLLRSVSCAGPSFCEAVGQIDGTSHQNLIETWNGSQWTIPANVPDTSSTEDQGLSGVDCFSQTTCSAVGQVGPIVGPSSATLALEWNGSSWSIVSNTPNEGTGSNLNGESCITDWACVAVGFYTTSGEPDGAPFAMMAPIARSGYYLVGADGGIFSFDAQFYGSTGGQHLNEPIVGMAVMPGGDGYYLVASDGGVFNYGSARFYGSLGSLHLNKPIVGMALTADGAGYWLVASDGGVFSFGDAIFYGSTGGMRINAPVVGMAATPDGKGYYLVGADGGIYNYGAAPFYGSAGNLVLNKPIVGMAVPTEGGYYLVGSDGGVFSYPVTDGPPFYGSTGSITLNKPIVGMLAVQGGYYLAASDGGVFAFPNTLPFWGSMGSTTLNAPIVGIAG